MTDPAASASALDDLVGAVLAQAVEIAELDGPRAEAWASDVLALAVETVVDDDPVAALITALSSGDDDAAATSLCALSAFVPGIPTRGRPGTAPAWAESIGTSRVEDACLLENRGAMSAVFRFVDSLDVRHVVTVDLLGGSPERLGEVVVGPGDLLDALDEDDADLAVVVVPPPELAIRVAAALRATDRPRESAVVNGRLLVARLASITGEEMPPPVGVAEVVPVLPARERADDAFAIEILDRALGRPDTTVGWEELAATVRARGADHDELAAWFAAAGGATDDSDEAVALAPIVAAVAPVDLGPLDPSRRDAVMALEWADWLGAVIGLVRTGEGAAVDGETLVDHVNRCPEVTSTIPKQDRARLAWAFDVVGESWAVLGLTDDGALTDRGITALPAALRRAWAVS